MINHLELRSYSAHLTAYEVHLTIKKRKCLINQPPRKERINTMRKPEAVVHYCSEYNYFPRRMNVFDTGPAS